METQIYYFSGTGNSLFAARELQKRIPDAGLVPIASLINEPKVKTRAAKVGLVFPVHALTIPIVVKRFIKKTDFDSARCIFAVATRLGTSFYGFDKIDALLKKKRKKLGAHLALNMGNNEARHAGYTVPSKEHLQAMENEAIRNLDVFADIISAEKTSRPPDTGVTQPTGKSRLSSFLIERAVLAGMNIAGCTGGVQYFCADDNCTGCGICQRVCLSGKITMKDNKPVWQKDVLCTMCFACLNYCPKRAVQINDISCVPSFTRSNGRYPHPYACADDIIKQKNI